MTMRPGDEISDPDVRSSVHRPRHATPDPGDPTAVIPKISSAGADRAQSPVPPVPPAPAVVPGPAVAPGSAVAPGPAVPAGARPEPVLGGAQPEPARFPEPGTAPPDRYTDRTAIIPRFRDATAGAATPATPSAGDDAVPTSPAPAGRQLATGGRPAAGRRAATGRQPATGRPGEVTPTVPLAGGGATLPGGRSPAVLLERTMLPAAALEQPPGGAGESPAEPPDTPEGDPGDPPATKPALPHLKDDMTMVMPVAGDPRAETTLFAAVPDSPAEVEPDPEPQAQPGPRWGPRIVALRPVRGREGYRSVYSDLTRTTGATVARTIARTTGEVLITLGLVVLLFAGYEVWGKTAIVDTHQNTLSQQLNQDWAHPPIPANNGLNSLDAGAPTGAALARLYIPSLHKQWVVVQGVTEADIRYAPGHYPQTAMPGQVGNFSVAGHRIPAIFWNLDQLHGPTATSGGDWIVVETRTEWFVYQVQKVEIVSPYAIQVVAPVPDHPGVTPTQKWLTLTTCNPKWDNYQRLIVHALLVDQQPRTMGVPAQLGS